METHGDYELLSVLAEGGMGTVHRARQVSLDRIVALKVMRPDTAFGDARQLLARFERERQLHASLDHPRLVKILDAGVLPVGPYFSMEMLDGPTLDDLLAQSGKLDGATVRRHMVDIASGLAYLHGRSVLHRDLKPSNVLIDRRLGLKILDFGLARDESMTHFTSAGEIVGTVEYLAPECFTDRESSRATDVYALGMIGYELITGRTPYPVEPIQAHILAKVRGDLPPLESFAPDAPPHLVEAIRGLLEKEPSARWTLEQFLDHVRAGADGERDGSGEPLHLPRIESKRSTVMTPSAGAGGRASHPAPVAGSGARRAVGAAALALLGLGLIASTMRGRSPAPAEDPAPAPSSSATSPEPSVAASRSSPQAALSALRDWHSRIYQALPEEKIDGRHWIRLLLALARATRALPSLDSLADPLEKPGPDTREAARRALATLGGAIGRGEVAEALATAPRLLDARTAEIDASDRWMILECLVPFRLLSLCLEHHEVTEVTLPVREWSGQLHAPGGPHPRVDPRQGWQQIRAYVYPAWMPSAHLSQIGLMHVGVNTQGAHDRDLLTGSTVRPQRMKTHLEIPLEVPSCPGGADCLLDVRVPPVHESHGPDRRPELIWLQVGNHHPLLWSIDDERPCNIPTEKPYLRLRQRLPAMPAGPVTVTLARESFAVIAHTGDDATPLNVGWLRLLCF